MAAKNMEEIAELFKKLRFQKKLVGGIDEADVWKQLDMLQREYRNAYDAQEEYYQALLDERNAMIARLKRRNAEATETAGEPNG